MVGTLYGIPINHPRMAWIYCGSLPLVGANLGWHALRYPHKSSTHGVDLLRQPASGGCQPWLARSTVSAKNHPRMAWIYRGSLPLVGANLGWHALRYPRRIIHAWRGSTAAACPWWVPTLVGTLYGICLEPSTHGVDLPRQPAPGGCQPWLARSTASAWNHPRMAWIYRGSLPLVGANLGWHALRYPRRTIHAWRGSTEVAPRPRDSRVSPASQALAQPQDASCTRST